MSKRKGRSGEQELARILRDRLGLDIIRNQNQTAIGGHDLDGIPGVAIEVKRCAKLTLPAWWRQAVRQAEKSKQVPVLAYRIDRGQWKFVMALRDIHGAYFGQERSLEMTGEFGVESFCCMMRERM